MPFAKRKRAPAAALQICLVMLSVVSAAIVAGCAGTAQGIDSSVYSRLKAGKATSQTTPEAAALVIIRYPAMIHDYAENLYVSSFAIKAIGGEVTTSTAKSQAARIAQSVVEKSSYYAMSLYRELKAELPEASVLLSPHIIAWDKKRQLYTRPILATEQVPSVLTIDFNVYSYPDINKIMDSPPVTFGDLVTPLIVVKGNRWIQPALNGLLIASPPLASSAWRQATRDGERHFNSRLEGRGDDEVASLDFIAFLRERNKNTLQIPFKTAMAGSSGSFAIEQYPLEKIQMDGAAIAALEDDGSVDPFVSGFVKGASRRIIDMLSSIDQERATFFARQRALGRFDPELANVFFVQSGDESVRARLQLAEALVGAERTFLAAQSDSIYEGTYAGSYGLKMRKIIAAEYRMLEQRRHLARKQNMTTAVAAIALAGSVYGTAVASTSAGAASVAAVSGAALGGSVWAMHQSFETRTESEEVGKYFMARMAPAFDRQMSVQMEWLESKEVITAKGFAEFRNKTLSLYQSRVRTMRISGSEHCRFKHPGLRQTGRWYGVCQHGLASGRGYGLIRNGQGDSVEYLGEARKGLASGTGGMIIRKEGQLAANYYEGSFKNGRLDGTVRIEKPGSQPQLRRFKAGVDAGRGNADLLQRLSFVSSQASDRSLKP